MNETQDSQPEIFRLEFGTYERHANFIVGTPDPNREMGVLEANEINRVVASAFTQPFAYIGNRTDINSIDPMAYIFARRENPLFTTMAVVCHPSVGRRFTEIEEDIAQKAELDFQIFSDLDGAVEWVRKTLPKKD